MFYDSWVQLLKMMGFMIKNKTNIFTLAVIFNLVLSICPEHFENCLQCHWVLQHL